MYELHIKCLDGVWRTADLGKDNPAINYQSNNLDELRDTNNNYSQELRLPLSPNNAIIFEHADVFDVLTDTPYEYFDCRLYRNGCTLAGKGAKLLLRGISDVYETQIASGNIDFFTNIKNKQVEELDLGYVTQNLEDITGAGGKYYKYAFANFRFGGIESVPEAINVGDLYPFAMYKPIIEKIVTDQGFTLETNLKDEDWDTKAISICSLIDDGEGMKPFEAEATTSYDYYSSDPNDDPVRRKIYWESENTGNGCLQLPFPFNSYRSNMVEYEANANLTLRIELMLENTGEDDVYVPLEKINIQGETIALLEQDYYSHLNKVIEIEMLKGEIITLYYGASKKGGEGVAVTAPYYEKVNFTSSIKFIPRQEGNVPLGGKINISKNLGFKSQSSLFGTFVQLYGLTVSADNVNKVIRAYTFDKVIENKKHAKDWSKKLDISKNPTQAFKLGEYGQNNKISFIDNDRDMTQDFAIFEIYNGSLPDQKDLFAVSFEAGKNQTHFMPGTNAPRTFASIPLVEVTYDDAGAEKKEFKKGKPHLVEISAQTVSVTLGPYRRIELNCAIHPRMKTFVDTYYPKLINHALYKARVLICKFLLTEQDIEEFDQFIPVYIDYFGAYFYVNKIINYGAKFLTECELIRLKDNGRR